MRRDRVRLLRLLVQQLTERLNRWAPLDDTAQLHSAQEWLHGTAAGTLTPAERAALDRDFSNWLRLQRRLALVESVQRQYRELLLPEQIDADTAHPYNKRTVQHQELPPAE
jgi:hypothetical protein